MTEVIDNMIDAIVTIGNHERIIKECEPNVSKPMELKKWMVVRTLKAFLLFEEAMKNKEKNHH